jgi:16S rRNA (cytidine1402-2'-O)-methyltransferase
MPEDHTKKERPWLLPPAQKKTLKPGLYLVATPIGNLGDVTLRALDVLSAANLIVCEDTRVAGKLVSHFGISNKLLPYNDHNAGEQRARILKTIQDGGCVALISDAGTPLISDPGYKLVQACLEAELYVSAVPGANAVLTALQLSGLPSDAFCFIGFLPNKSGARKKELARWKDTPATLISYETAPRLIDALEDIRNVLGEREVAVVRELTKLFEEVRRGPISQVIDHYKVKGEPKGEIVLVIGAGAAKKFSEDDVRKILSRALKSMSTKEAAAHVAEETGWVKKKLYDLALEISGK